MKMMVLQNVYLSKKDVEDSDRCDNVLLYFFYTIVVYFF